MNDIGTQAGHQMPAGQPDARPAPHRNGRRGRDRGPSARRVVVAELEDKVGRVDSSMVSASGQIDHGAVDAARIAGDVVERGRGGIGDIGRLVGGDAFVIAGVGGRAVAIEGGLAIKQESPDDGDGLLDRVGLWGGAIALPQHGPGVAANLEQHTGAKRGQAADRRARRSYSSRDHEPTRSNASRQPDRQPGAPYRTWQGTTPH